MKNIDTFYLSEKQAEQMKRAKKTRINKRVIFAVLLLAISVVSLLGSNYICNETIKMILTGVGGFSGVGIVIVLMSDAPKTGGSFNPEFQKEIEEARREEGYFGK